MSTDEPAIDTEHLRAPTEGRLMTHFLTAPLDRDAETRCCMRDPDGFLIGRRGRRH